MHDSQSRLNKRLKAYLAEPENEKNVHDVRTSVRRLDVMFSLLPRKIRRLNRRKIDEYRKFFRANSRVRDLDVIRAKLEELSPNPGMLEHLQQKRKVELKRAIKLARSVRNMRPVRVDSLPSNKFKSRIGKITDRLSERIKTTFPVVLSDVTKIDELHRLRKDCKKLRYVIEVLPARSARAHEGKVPGAVGKKGGVKLLAELQRVLGDIRDCDITIQYLSRARSEGARELLAKEAANRARLYRDFVEYVK